MNPDRGFIGALQTSRFWWVKVSCIGCRVTGRPLVGFVVSDEVLEHGWKMAN